MADLDPVYDPPRLSAGHLGRVPLRRHHETGFPLCRWDDRCTALGTHGLDQLCGRHHADLVRDGEPAPAQTTLDLEHTHA